MAKSFAIYGQELPGWTSLFKIVLKSMPVTNFRNLLFLISDWSTIMGRPKWDNHQKFDLINFHFQHSTKKLYKVETFYKSENSG